MHVFILAGGFATRLWPLTEKRAKPLLPLSGKPTITHILEKIPAHLPVTVSTNAAFEAGFRDWHGTVEHPDVKLVIEGTTHDDRKLGTLGALSQWIEQEKIDDDILVLTGDNYFGFPLESFLKAHKPDTALLAAYDIKNLEHAKAFGTVILGPDGKSIEAFEEKPMEPKTTLVSTGCSILPRSTLPVVREFAAIKPDNVGGIFEEFLCRNIPVESFTFTEPWLDVGSFHSYLDAHRLLVGEETILGPGAVVTDTETSGSNWIGAHTTVKGSHLRDCMIFGNCIITDCTLENCIIDEGCVLKGIDVQNQMLREKTRLVL